MAWQGRAGRARRGKAWQGLARRGLAGLGEARHGFYFFTFTFSENRKMKITIEVTGTSPLLMHNPRMADPEFEITREIKTLTDKKNKTEEDFSAIERLEWYGGLYTHGVNGSEVVVQPTSKLRKCLINAAKMSSLGTAVQRSLQFNDVQVPLIYDGPEKKEELFADPRFHSRLSVGIGKKRVMRVRPQFFPWGMVVDGYFVTDAGLKLDQLKRIVEMAGIIEGIGDNRVNGYGRFEAKLKKAK